MPAGNSNGDKPSIHQESLQDVRPLYFLPNDNLSGEVLIPAFENAESAQCMVGFFNSNVLASIAPGLASYINFTNGIFRLIISPYLSEDDREAIATGQRSAEKIAVDQLSNLIITEESLQQHTLKCLSYLLSMGRLQIKVALLKNGLFHPKVWLFTFGTDSLAAHGSSNLTGAGLHRNYEQVSVAKSWADPTQRYIVEKFSEQFHRLWNEKEEDCVVVDATRAIKDELVQSHPMPTPPTEDDYHALYRKARGEDNALDSDTTGSEDDLGKTIASADNRFRVPDWLVYDSGPFEHQGRAVSAWCDAGFNGILEMATGAGKTIAAMVCAHRLHAHRQPLLVVVAAPYIPLIQQWCGEIAPFGITPTNLTNLSGPRTRAQEMKRLRRRLRGNSSVEIAVVTHNTICELDFHNVVGTFECTKLLIADEVHNLGRNQFIAEPPEMFDHRLGLSATPVRQYDDEGTSTLFQYFGGVVFRFPLEEAIGRCLVEYDYYVHPVYLTADEMDSWYEITRKIKANAWRENDTEPDEYLAKLLRDRRTLLENAENKIGALASALDQEDLRDLRHSIVYTTDKAPKQLEDVNAVLRSRGLLFRQLTHYETSNREQTTRILDAFREGDLQVLTAKRVLDEGINVPEIRKAFILASTTVERQWIQRRGRLLRTCKEIGKTHSEIHDFVALPPELGTGLDDDASKLVRSELTRIQEFAKLARNAGREDGPLPMIHELSRAVYG